MELLNADNVNIQYGANLCVKNANMHIGSGEIVALVGRSGQGKTSILKVLAGLQAPVSGVVRVYDQKIVSGKDRFREDMPARSKPILVPQVACLLPHLSVLDNIALGIHVLGRLCYVDTTKLAMEYLTCFNLNLIANKFPAEISGGEAQRVQLTRALVLDPDILLLDEVTASLDSFTISHIVEVLRKCRKNKGKATLFVTHSWALVETLADRVYIIEDHFVKELSHISNQGLSINGGDLKFSNINI